MKKLFVILVLLVLAACVAIGYSDAMNDSASGGTEVKIDPKEIIFEHLGDAYGWEMPFAHHRRIPLPIILIASDGLHCFSSARVAHGHQYKDGNVTFEVPEEGEYKGKCVEILPDGQVSKPWDISITKNVLAIFLTIIIVFSCCFALVRWYRRNGFKAPKGMLGFLELIVCFIYDGVVKSTLGHSARRFAPYLLTVFFFIFFMNLLGLVVIFPGGANLTGNIAVTMTLAILTFLVTNIFGTKHYWKDIFWPDVPLWLKFPLPIMPMIELFGIFTKPAALTVRLFANMMGGHMIVIVLTLLIFIFTAVGGVMMGGTTAVVSILFSIFMLLIDVLVSFIQAYVFTMLSTIFISLAQEGSEHEHEKHEHDKVAAATTEK
ncbi:MAG: F0F1 ATP synthase subunit A [Bacteroidales bacterium]|nr:F0F1 ATP synthase subunit A [Bacteroidales bacterium]